MKILVVSPKNKPAFNFRGDLIKDMIAKGNEVYLTGPNRDFIEDVMALGIKEFIEIPLVKDNTNPKGDLVYLQKLTQCMKELRPDLVFSNTAKPVIYGSIAAHRAGVKRIYGMITGMGRAYSAQGKKAHMVRSVTKVMYKIALKHCDKVIFQNPDDVTQMVEMGCLSKDKACIVNGSGVNMKRFKRTPLPDDLTFLMVSRIIKEKGVVEYCEAAKIVKSKFPQARFILLGAFDNAIGGLSREFIKEHIDSNLIEMPGEVKDSVPYYNRSTVFVLPSYYREGLPRSILEALALGRPVITTDWPGCRLTVEDGVNGYLIPIKDPVTLADRMLRLAGDRQLIEKMGEKSYELCCKKFDVNLVNRQMRDIMKY